MFKSKPKPKTPTSPEIASPEMKVMANVEFKSEESSKQQSKEDLKQIGQSSTPETSLKQAKVLSDKSEVPTKSEESNGKPSQHSEVQPDLDDPNLKKDLIHTVLNAVQENWLNQAPKPTLDKAAALQVGQIIFRFEGLCL